MLSLTKPEKLIFSYTFSLFLFAFFPLMIVGYYQYDDIGRSVDGYLRWSSDGRFVPDLLFKTLMMGEAVHDISPLPQIIAIFFISINALIIKKISPTLSVFSCVLTNSVIFATPLFLENMSYVYDSMTMVISITTATAAAYMVLRGNRFKLTTSAVLLFIALSTYQVSINVYLIFVVAGSIATATSYKIYLKNVIYSLSPVLIALILYKLSIPLYPIGSYQASHSGTVSASEILTVVPSNIYGGLSYLARMINFNVYYTIIISALFIISCLSFTLSLHRKFGIILIGFISIVVLITMVVGIQSILSNPVWKPRTAIGFGAVYAALLAFSLTDKSRVQLNRILVTISVLYLGAFITFSYSQAAYLRNVKLYQQVYVSKIADEINKARYETGLTSLSIVGWQTYPSSIQNSLVSAPYLRMVNDSPIYGEGWWSLRSLHLYGMDADINLSGKDWREVCSTTRQLRYRHYGEKTGYTIESNGEALVLIFNGGCD